MDDVKAELWLKDDWAAIIEAKAGLVINSII